MKSLNEILPVDEAIQRKGGSIASHCVCCKSPPATGSCAHLFLSSELSTLWHSFGVIFGIRVGSLSLCLRLNDWWLPRTQEDVKFLHQFVSSLLRWEIWKGRIGCKLMDLGWWCIKSINRLFLLTATVKVSHLSANLSTRLMFCTFLQLYTKSMVLVVQWKKSMFPFVKLNCDGCSKNK